MNRDQRVVLRNKLIEVLGGVEYPEAFLVLQMTFAAVVYGFFKSLGVEDEPATEKAKQFFDELDKTATNLLADALREFGFEVEVKEAKTT